MHGKRYGPWDNIVKHADANRWCRLRSLYGWCHSRLDKVARLSRGFGIGVPNVVLQ